MELCTTTPQAISNLPIHHHHQHHKLIVTNTTAKHSSNSSFPLRQSPKSGNSIKLHSQLLLPRAATSEETSNGANAYATEEQDGFGGATQPEKNLYNQTWIEEAPKEDSKADSVDGQAQIFEFFNNLDLKLDNDETVPVLVYGGGALLALWLASAVVGAIDSIPLFPKLLEVVGLGYTIWFSSRYLIFKKNREELVSKIELLKQQVLGLDDD